MLYTEPLVAENASGDGPQYFQLGADVRAIAIQELPLPEDLMRRARSAIERVLSDEYAFVLAGYESVADDYGDGAQTAVYVARQLQLHAAAVVEKLTGKPMPTGAVRHPWHDDPDDAHAAIEYPDLPPVGGAL
jgi:hypothetical protein